MTGCQAGRRWRWLRQWYDTREMLKSSVVGTRVTGVSSLLVSSLMWSTEMMMVGSGLPGDHGEKLLPCKELHCCRRRGSTQIRGCHHLWRMVKTDYISE